ncbi:hypothetical protein SUGI_0323740 [Cryptomeria japonica]|uniref:uncharacterized protein LOC131066388 n=1 Tax=Cryptomeria japonica TaxID=3369 RepID=UPI002408C4F2|nr:uncharacterized protein LOC131066388 [Cryptomeria japonica]XP_057857126.2 uncharacterized protein LOC131066388 [Cryptomeria japonica]XP_057857128.2 uncharacterized protein LOC131066388 [Cryptomeria japonica]GLJ18296.1 hypothetical protein SUGI_0323740 [Cryptomeria japonica]
MGDWHALSAGPLTSGGSQDRITSMNSKRQRRPSVRLGEIGDYQTLASFRKRKGKWEEKQMKGAQEGHPKGSLLQLPCGLSKQSTEVVVSGGLGSSNKLLKKQHSGNENRYSHEQLESAIELQRQESPNSLLAREEDQTMVLQGVVDVASRKVQLDFRAASKRARHGSIRKAVRTRISSAVGKGGESTYVKPEPSLFHSLAFFNKKHAKSLQNRQQKSASRANDENDEGSREDGFGEPLSNASYDIYTPEGFRHSDLETSDSPGDMKEKRLAVQEASLEGRVVSVGLSHGQQIVKEACQNERDESVSGQIGQAKLGETWAMINAEKLTGPRHSTNGVMIMELEAETNVKDIPSSGRHGTGSLGNGVKAWLNGIGLGRYAQIFEMHEVDMDVLHFLTFDDLKEMGINAVGSRRKIYTSIQQLGKSFTV